MAFPRIRKMGPQGTVRPFQPTIDIHNSISIEEKQLEVLESIAVSLAGIDHNLELLAKSVQSLSTR